MLFGFFVTFGNFRLLLVIFSWGNVQIPFKNPILQLFAPILLLGLEQSLILNRKDQKKKTPCTIPYPTLPTLPKYTLPFPEIPYHTLKPQILLCRTESHVYKLWPIFSFKFRTTWCSEISNILDLIYRAALITNNLNLHLTDLKWKRSVRRYL